MRKLTWITLMALGLGCLALVTTRAQQKDKPLTPHH